MENKEWKLVEGPSPNLSPNHRGGQKRPAFTLVELLVVITIIAILVALTAGATLRFMGVQQQTNSEVVVRKVYKPLERQWQIVIDKASKEPLPPNAPAGSPLALAYANIYQMAGNDPARTRVIWIKARLRQEFPMNYTEILMASPNVTLNPQPPGALPALPSYVSALAAAGIVSLANVPNSGNYVPDGYEISNCLLMALSRSRDGIALNAEDLGSDVLVPVPPSALFASPTFQYIADAWKQPVIFFRWPTANTEVNALNPAPIGTSQVYYGDQQDPNGLLMNPTWWNGLHPYPGPSTGAWYFEQTFHPLFNLSPTRPGSGPPSPPDPNWPALGPPAQPPTPFPATSPPFGGPPPNQAPYNPYYVIAASYYTMPVVASGGKNKRFGIQGVYPNLAQPQQLLPASGPSAVTTNSMQFDNSGDDQDNIYSYRLR